MINEGSTEAFRRFYKQAKIYEVMFFDKFFPYQEKSKSNMFSKFIQYSIHLDKTHMLKTFPSGKIKVNKSTLFFSFTKHKVRLFKTVCWIFHFRLCFVLLKYIFLFNKKHGLFDFKTSQFISKKNKIHTSFAPRPLAFKVKQEFLKFSDIYVISSSPKTDLETNFLILENQSFENASFSQ